MLAARKEKKSREIYSNKMERKESGPRVALSGKMSEKTYGKQKGEFPHPHSGHQKDWPGKGLRKVECVFRQEKIEFYWKNLSGNVWY